MKIRTQQVWNSTTDPDWNWNAIDDDTYDGAPDSSNRNQVGWGATEEKAIEDLKRILEEDSE